VLIALTVGQKLGLGGVAAVFIVFALASSFLLPRSAPDFPGRRGVRWFVAVSVLMFVSMLTAVVVFARESEEGGAHGSGQVELSEEESDQEDGAANEEQGTPGTTQEQAETTTTPPAPTEEEAAKGDAEAGQTVYASAGCGGCHTLVVAGSTGAIGPNLDESKPSYDLVVDRVTNGKGVMPAFGDGLSEQEIADVAAFVVEASAG